MAFNIFLLKEKTEKVAAIQWESSCNTVWKASLISEYPKGWVSRTVEKSRTAMGIPLVQSCPFSPGAGSRDRVVWASRKTQDPKDSEKHIKGVYNRSTFECKAETQHVCFSFQQGVWEVLPPPHPVGELPQGQAELQLHKCSYSFLLYAKNNCWRINFFLFFLRYCQKVLLS